MRLVIAPDSYKGGPGARAVAEALARGWRSRRPADDIELLPLADGGEGTIDALDAAVGGARRETVAGVPRPDGVPVDAEYLMLPDGTAVIELASSSGLPLLDEPDPLGASTRGMGEVIAAALDAGAHRFLIGIGGSASTDGGTGALRALGLRLLDPDGQEVPDGGGALEDVASVDASGLRPPPAEGVEVLTDVDNPLLGPRGAAAVFGPQKGADAAQIARLDAALAHLADVAGGDRDAPGAGAAGGTGWGFATFWGATLRLGSAAIAEAARLDRALEGATVVITGEGAFDATSLGGKVPGWVIKRAQDAGTPVTVVAGQVLEAPAAFTGTVVSLADLAGSAQASIAEPERWLEAAGARLAAEHGG